MRKKDIDKALDEKENYSDIEALVGKVKSYWTRQNIIPIIYQE